MGIASYSGTQRQLLQKNCFTQYQSIQTTVPEAMKSLLQKNERAQRLSTAALAIETSNVMKNRSVALNPKRRTATQKRFSHFQIYGILPFTQSVTIIRTFLSKSPCTHIFVEDRFDERLVYYVLRYLDHRMEHNSKNHLFNFPLH